MTLSRRDTSALKRGILIMIALVAGSRLLPTALRWRAEPMAREATLSAEVRRRTRLLAAHPSVRTAQVQYEGPLREKSTAEGAGRLSSLLSSYASDMRVQMGSMEPSADSAHATGLTIVGVRASGLADIAGLVGLVERLESDETTMRLRSLRIVPANPTDSDQEAERLRFELEVEALVDLQPDESRARR